MKQHVKEVLKEYTVQAELNGMSLDSYMKDLLATKEIWVPVEFVRNVEHDWNLFKTDNSSGVYKKNLFLANNAKSHNNKVYVKADPYGGFVFDPEDKKRVIAVIEDSYSNRDIPSGFWYDTERSSPVSYRKDNK